MTPARRPELRVVNPNTDVRITRWLAEEARRVAGEAFEIVAVNAASGVAAIQTPEEIERAGAAVVSALSSPPRPAGAIIAAFGDPGLSAARALRLTPVVGLRESGMLAAGQGRRRFAIVTIGAALRDSIVGAAAALGLGGQLAGVHFLPFSIGELVKDRDARREAITEAARACIVQDRAEAVLLGGAPFAGMADALARETGVVVLDGMAASVDQIVGAIRELGG